MRIELHIERLVLDGTGVEPRHAGAVRAAVETELTRLLTAVPELSWSSWQDRRLRRVTAPPVRLGGARNATALGRAVAHSLCVGIATPITSSGFGASSGSPGSAVTGRPR
jgi:hypothetical protein